MIGAARTHLRRGERQVVPANAVLGALALFVAIMRFGPNSLQRRACAPAAPE